MKDRDEPLPFIASRPGSMTDRKAASPEIQQLRRRMLEFSEMADECVAAVAWREGKDRRELERELTKVQTRRKALRERFLKLCAAPADVEADSGNRQEIEEIIDEIEVSLERLYGLLDRP